MPKPKLTVNLLKKEAKFFAQEESGHDEPSLYGVTDGKAVGTYLEHKFQKYLHSKYFYVEGSSAKGIDFPKLSVDMKVTSIKQPQSSCPFHSARQKIYGLGYSLLVFVYDKTDDSKTRTGRLLIKHTIFVEESRTADFQTTSGLRKILENNGNIDDVRAFFEERMLPVDEIQAQSLAEEVLANAPAVGYLTISNALQWRLQYTRVIQEAGVVSGIQRVL
ncbi:MAG: restriction endonuclease [Geobacter sp.]|nr:restriction endonuclease [Geobacter sp.]